jgi:hypothetical protein
MGCSFNAAITTTIITFIFPIHIIFFFLKKRRSSKQKMTRKQKRVKQ